MCIVSRRRFNEMVQRNFNEQTELYEEIASYKKFIRELQRSYNAECGKSASLQKQCECLTEQLERSERELEHYKTLAASRLQRGEEFVV